MDLSALSAEVLTPFVGSTFATEAAELTLVESSPLTCPPHVAGRRQPFRLQFSGAAPLLPQGVHCLTHAALEPLEIFLVPIGFSAERFTYEAIFN